MIATLGDGQKKKRISDSPVKSRQPLCRSRLVRLAVLCPKTMTAAYASESLALWDCDVAAPIPRAFMCIALGIAIYHAFSKIGWDSSGQKSGANDVPNGRPQRFQQTRTPHRISGCNTPVSLRAFCDRETPPRTPYLTRSRNR